MQSGDLWEFYPMFTLEATIDYTKSMLTSLEDDTGTSRRKLFSFGLISDRFTHRCFNVATMPTSDLPMAVVLCFMQQRVRSVVQHNSATSSGERPRLLSRSSVGQPGRLEAKAATAWPAAAYALPFRLDVTRRGLDGKESLKRRCLSSREIAG